MLPEHYRFVFPPDTLLICNDLQLCSECYRCQHIEHILSFLSYSQPLHFLQDVRVKASTALQALDIGMAAGNPGRD